VQAGVPQASPGNGVRFPVKARPMFRVEKVAIFFYPASGDKFLITAIEIKNGLKISSFPR
jgi:hypothetical protein